MRRQLKTLLVLCALGVQLLHADEFELLDINQIVKLRKLKVVELRMKISATKNKRDLMDLYGDVTFDPKFDQLKFLPLNQFEVNLINAHSQVMAAGSMTPGADRTRLKFLLSAEGSKAAERLEKLAEIMQHDEGIVANINSSEVEASRALEEFESSRSEALAVAKQFKEFFDKAQKIDPQFIDKILRDHPSAITSMAFRPIF